MANLNNLLDIKTVTDPSKLFDTSWSVLYFRDESDPTGAMDEFFHSVEELHEYMDLLNMESMVLFPTECIHRFDENKTDNEKDTDDDDDDKVGFEPWYVSNVEDFYNADDPDLLVSNIVENVTQQEKDYNESSYCKDEPLSVTHIYYPVLENIFRYNRS